MNPFDFMPADPDGKSLRLLAENLWDVAGADAGAIEMTKRLVNAVEAAQLAAFHPLELAIATVAQQRSAATEAARHR